MIVAVNSTYSSIYVIWDPPTPPHGILLYYRVTYHPVDQYEEVVEVETDGSITYINITGLFAWTTYVYRVAGFTVDLGEFVEGSIRTQETGKSCSNHLCSFLVCLLKDHCHYSSKFLISTVG